MKKKNVLLFAAVLTVGVFTSCGSNDPNELSAGTVEGLVEELLEESAQDQSYVSVQIGQYELNDQAARARLMQLQAAGVVTYKVERYAWWNKNLSVDYAYRYYEMVGGRYEKVGNVYYDFEEHFVVTVGLTEEGKKLRVDSIPQPQPKVDKDMEQPEFNPANFPESKVKLTEQWPYIPNPEAQPEPDNVIPREDKYDLGEALRREQFPEENYTPYEPSEEMNDEAPQRLSLDIQTSMAWDKLKDKLYEEQAILKSSRLKVKKARFIQIFDDPTTGIRRGTAEIIIEMTDVTPAGRVMEQKYDGVRLCSPVSLVFFYDKGWILQDKSLHLSTVSGLGILTSKSGRVEGGDVSATEAKFAETMAKGMAVETENEFDD